MDGKLKESVSVSFSFDSTTKKVNPRALVWNKRLYAIKKVGLHHTYRQGRTLFHVFSVASNTFAVGAYTSPAGCILSASAEAKGYGVKTGMRVWEGKKLCPSLLVLPSDPNKYREVHVKLRDLLGEYTNDFYPKSIDEFVLNFDGYPILKAMTMVGVGKEIKKG